MLLLETRFDNIIQESDSSGQKLYLKGIFMESERKNRNGRIYKRAEIEEQVRRVNEAAENNRHILGELDHPDQLVVKLENVSHKIIHMEMDGNNAIGKAEILPTPKGNIAKALIEAGVTIGVSSRGSGSVNEATNTVENFHLITVDLVASPSAIDAYPQSVYEHLQMYRNGAEIDKLAEAIRHDRTAQKHFEKEILRFIRSMDYKKRG